MKPLTQDYKHMIFRKPVPSDIIDLMSLVEEHCEEMNEDFDAKSIKSYLDIQISNLPSIIAEDDGEIVGAISFIIVPSDFKQDVFLGKKIAVFVKSKYRNNGIGKQLLEHAEKVCKDNGCIKFYFTGKIQPEGYNQLETEYVKEL